MSERRRRAPRPKTVIKVQGTDNVASLLAASAAGIADHFELSMDQMADEMLFGAVCLAEPVSEEDFIERARAAWRKNAEAVRAAKTVASA